MSIAINLVLHLSLNPIDSTSLDIRAGTHGSLRKRDHRGDENYTTHVNYPSRTFMGQPMFPCSKQDWPLAQSVQIGIEGEVRIGSQLEAALDAFFRTDWQANKPRSFYYVLPPTWDPIRVLYTYGFYENVIGVPANYDPDTATYMLVYLRNVGTKRIILEGKCAPQWVTHVMQWEHPMLEVRMNADVDVLASQVKTNVRNVLKLGPHCTVVAQTPDELERFVTKLEASNVQFQLSTTHLSPSALRALVRRVARFMRMDLRFIVDLPRNTAASEFVMDGMVNDLSRRVYNEMLNLTQAEFATWKALVAAGQLTGGNVMDGAEMCDAMLTKPTVEGTRVVIDGNALFMAALAQILIRKKLMFAFFGNKKAPSLASVQENPLF